MKDKIIRDLRVLYEPEEDYYEPKKIKCFFDCNYVEYESKEDRGKTLSIENYINMIRPYLSSMIEKHKDGWKIQLTADITFAVVDGDSEELEKKRPQRTLYYTYTW